MEAESFILTCEVSSFVIRRQFPKRRGILVSFLRLGCSGISSSSDFYSSGDLMRRHVQIVFLLAVVALISTLARAQQRGPSTPEERARAVQTAKALQSDPVAPNLQEDREWLLKWLIEVPDISVKMCTTFLGDLGDSKSGKPGAIIATLLASEAAFVIEHPEKAKDVDAVYLAGVDGALHSYEAIHSKDASFRLAHLEDLIQKRDQGKLVDYVHATAKKCK